MPRLFTGLEIPSDVGQSLATLRGGLPGARWIDPENYHVTLRFIGDVDDTIAREVASMLGRVRREAFELRVDDLKSFGGRKPRAIVAALGPAQALMELQAEHERLLQRVGLEPEGRKFTPHVTLARLRESSSRQVADYLAVRAPFRSPLFKVSRFVLFSSRSSVGGGPYVVEAAYPLAA
jgi:RNA 2',3'-cyclic 3'-phosphodiesterase